MHSSRLLEQEDGDTGGEEYLEEQDYATIRYRGTHRNAGEYYEKLLSYLDSHGLECCGDSLEITLIDSGFTNDTEKYITEIQIPIAKKT